MDILKMGYLTRTIVYNMNSFISDRLKPYGIGSGQFEYFMLVHLNDGINQQALADLKGVGKASVTKAINILEGHGLIQRLTGSKDKRNHSLHCTQKGKDIVNELLSYQKDLESVVFRDFTEYDKTNLMNLLLKMKTNTDCLRGI